LAILSVAVTAAFFYIVVLSVLAPQIDDDTIYDHLWRAALWRQHHAIGYPSCACAPYINAYPPHGEMGLLFAMVLGHSDRYVGLVQTAAYVVTAVSVLTL